MLGVTEQLRRQLRARGYDAATVAAVPTGGPSTAVYAVALGTGPGSRRWQGTVAELSFRIASLPRRARGARGSAVNPRGRVAAGPDDGGG